MAKQSAYHDLTGRFPHRSSRGNEYLLIVYHHDSNSILQAALKNKTGAEIKQNWTASWNIIAALNVTCLQQPENAMLTP